MQYHLNGFQPGDPHAFPSFEGNPVPAKEVDVLIVGCGPAGLTLAAQLCRFADISTRIIEQKSGRMEKGQADGVSCRSMEMFQAFGFAHRILKEAYWVNQTVFWAPDPEDKSRIVRSGRVQDVEDGLSEMPHVILNQARIHDMYLQYMLEGPARIKPEYGKEFIDLKIGNGGAYPVEVKLDCGDGKIECVRARYVVGCDGARSGVREAIGQKLVGDSANQLWGVMDVLAVTDFPDIRLKAVIQAETEGTVLIIPREGGHLVRLYVEQGKLGPGERASDQNTKVEHLIEKANRVLHPYSLDVKDVVWWSAYQIGQRLTGKFDDVPAGNEDNQLPRVFIAGDACHTHSPKAGQGMNVSMGDAFNLGWKLKSVLRGECGAKLLHSYTAERQAVAQELIDFDRHWAQAIRDQGPISPKDDMPPVQRQFIRQGRYTAGISVTYAPSELTGPSTWQSLASGFCIGSRFHSAPVIRLADAKRVELGHTVEADGRWRTFIISPKGDATNPNSAVSRLCDYLSNAEASPLIRFRNEGEDIDAQIDVKAVLQTTPETLNVTDLPPLLLPRKGRCGLLDYEKAFGNLPDATENIYDLRGIDPMRGCVVIVRPDQYIGHVLPIDAFDELSAYFSGIMKQRLDPQTKSAGDMG